MRAQYDALIRQSGAIAYWPLGRHLGRELIAGNDFTTFPPVRQSQEFGDFTRFFGGATGQSASRAAVLTATNNFSIEFWVRPMSASQGWEIINASSGGTNGYTFGYRFADGRYYAIAQGVALLETSTRAMPLGVWNHVVMMRNANVWQYYVNGVRTDTGATSNNPIAPSGANVEIRSSLAPGTVADFMGLAQYTRVLTQSEIRDHYLMGSGQVGSFFFAAPSVILDYQDFATVYIDIQVSSADVAATNDAATVPIRIIPSATFLYTDAATIPIDISFLGGECFSTFSGLMMDAEADTRWYGLSDTKWFVSDVNTRWETGDIQVEGVNC